MKKVMFVVSLLVIGVLLVSACAAPKETAPAAPPATKTEVAPAPVTPVIPAAPVASAVDAKKLYDTNCAACHGPNRQGVTGLGKPLTPESLSLLSDDVIRTTILNGKPNTLMLGWEGRLSIEQINALIQLIKYTPP
ncbi:MAG: cytochrome c [Chloroflexi bacterium]|nr:cytochrome c [Chloroflexota bacterium]